MQWAWPDDAIMMGGHMYLILDIGYANSIDQLSEGKKGARLKPCGYRCSKLISLPNWYHHRERACGSHLEH